MLVRYVARRILYSFLVLLGVQIVTFFLVRLTGDPALLLAPPDAREEDIELIREQLGLDGPIYLQFLRYMADVAQLDFGESIRFSQPVSKLLIDRFPATLELGAAALGFALVVGFSVGTVSAVFRNSWADYLGRTVALLGQAIPVYWSGIMLVLVLSVQLGWLPVSGRQGLASLVMPALTVGLYLAAGIVRLLRSSLLDVLTDDYIRTARAKGLPESTVILTHALRNGLLPVVTLIGLQVGLLMSGVIITETVFAWPGLGQLSVQAASARDFPLIQGIVLFTASLIVLANLIVDILYVYIDPRVRYT